MMTSFLVVGDWGRQGTPEQRTVADGMAHVARRTRSQFVISTGDNFYEDGVANADDPLWQESFEVIYTAPSLQVPWYAVLGNHDYRGNVPAQIAYARRSLRWRMPARYYALERAIDDRTRAQFIFLDTVPFLEDYHQPGRAEYMPAAAEQDVEQQLCWLDRTLAGSTAPWKIAVGHHPIRSASPHHGDSEELIRQIRPLLVKHGVQAYLCGHEHDVQHLRDGDGLHHVVSGAGSTHRETGVNAHTRFSRSTLGFAAVTLSATEMRMQFFDARGQLLYTTRQQHVPSSSEEVQHVPALVRA